MNNVPVAWAYIKDGEFWDAIHPDEHAQEEGSYTIPLYTHPHPDNLGLAESIIKQQQAEIEALKEELDKQGKMIPFTESEIKYSKPQFPNKPVGWWDGNHKNVIGISKTKECEDWIPLYTHPVKEQDESFDRAASHMAGEYVSYKAELTDELNNLKKENKFFKEILSEMDKQVYNIEFLKQPMQILENGQIVPLFKELTDEEIISEWVGCERNYYNFARAILLKAQEK